MSMIEELKNLGLDVEEGLDRVMGDSSLYEMMLGMFVNSVRDNPVSPEDFDSQDPETVAKTIHMLKGITGNLAITPLFEGYTKSLTLLRGGQIQDAKAEFKRVLPIQTEIIECINRHQNA